jgi:tetratricopeptide (TPR) repeat protein
LEINPNFSDAANNLGNVYLDLGRYDEAIPFYKKALDDMLFKAPYLAENNLGWALYKKGQLNEAMQHFKAALVHNPKFCQSWRNLGLIHVEQKQFEKARDEFTEFAKHCPDQCEAHYQLAKALLTLNNQGSAKESLEQCSKMGGAGDCGAECRKLVELMK